MHAVFTPDSLYNGSNQSLVSGRSSFRPGQHDIFVVPENMQKPLCGQSRPHFFRGVATAVTKLFNIVEPDIAVFGKKDYQQWRIISTLVRELDFAIELIGGSIQREEDGLALSSRNKRLSEKARGQATCICRGLSMATGAWQAGLRDSGQISQLVKGQIVDGGGEIDYVDVVDAEHLQPLSNLADRPGVIAVAAWFEGHDGSRVRLIDNVELWDGQQPERNLSLETSASVQVPPTV